MKDYYVVGKKMTRNGPKMAKTQRLSLLNRIGVYYLLALQALVQTLHLEPLLTTVYFCCKEV